MPAGSIYDADNGKRPLRYSIDGRVVEGTIVDREGRDVTGEETGKTRGATLGDVFASLRQARGAITSQDQPARSGIAEAMARYRQIRQMEAQFPNPGAETIKVHRSGLLRTPNPRDQARFDADKANYDLAILEAHLESISKR